MVLSVLGAAHIISCTSSVRVLTPEILPPKIPVLNIRSLIEFVRSLFAAILGRLDASQPVH